MHADERRFLDVLIRANWPADLRLIYADWLMEHDDDEHANEIREHVLHIWLRPHVIPYEQWNNPPHSEITLE